jgi:Kef-type K+ transport system membrane component KefB
MTLAPGVVRAGLVATAVVLAAAFLFGLWHVVVGGLVHGNPRAAGFGAVLTTLTSAGLIVLGALVRRARRD